MVIRAERYTKDPIESDPTEQSSNVVRDYEIISLMRERLELQMFDGPNVGPTIDTMRVRQYACLNKLETILKYRINKQT